jgi:hypothetical protein
LFDDILNVLYGAGEASQKPHFGAISENIVKSSLLLLLVCALVGCGSVHADDNQAQAGEGRIATLAVTDLRDYDAQPPGVQRLIARALDLTRENLSYQYGSSDPKNGGMDCSGTVYYLLSDAGLKDVPRDSSGMYKWVWTQGRFRSVVSPNPDTFELAPLKPGDLLFWTGTYDVDRDPPVTHVMIYLGVNRLTGRRVMVGASEGRRFNDVSRYGVSVFDFEMPKHEKGDTGTSRFVGYGAVPGLLDGAVSSGK